MRNRGVTKNQEIIGWLQILMKILFNEIAPKMHIFRATRIGSYMFFQHCSSGGGHTIFDHQIEGVTKVLPRYFRKFMTHPIPPYDRKSMGRVAKTLSPFGKISSNKIKQNKTNKQTNTTTNNLVRYGLNACNADDINKCNFKIVVT